MPRTTSRGNAKANVLATLKPAEMPHPPTGQEDPHMPSRGDLLLPATSHNFPNAKMIDAPVLNHQTGDITMGRRMQHFLNPEEHIANTSKAPGATGMSKAAADLPTSERAAAGMMGLPVPAYGGSTDARHSGTLEHRSTRRVWSQKEREAAQPKGATERKRYRGMMHDVPVHGAGLHDALMSGEDVRSPVHLIVDPREPKYGPRINTAGTDIEEHDSGGFGHSEPVQWQGHHRVVAAALKQQKLRQAGAKNWQVPVPYELHHSTDAALAHAPMMAASENITETRYKRKKALRQVLGGNRGTWNPKAY